MWTRKPEVLPDSDAIGFQADLPLELHRRVPHRAYTVASTVEVNIASWTASSHIVERRGSHRVGYRQPLLVTPLDDQTGEPNAPAMIVVGRDISLSGLSFTHRDPLSCRTVGCTFKPLDEEKLESVIVRLTWCRFTRQRLYQSGGKFLQIVELTVNAPIDWSKG